VLLGARILCNLKRELEWFSLNAEVLSWCARVLAALGAEAPPAIEAELQIVATRHHMALGAFHAAIPTAQRAVMLLRPLGAQLPLAYALTLLARALASQPTQRVEADRAIDEALTIYDAAQTEADRVRVDSRTGDSDLVRVTMSALATAFKAFTIDPQEIDRRRELLTEAVARYRVLHAGHYIIGVMLESLSDVELEAGNYDAALERALESVEFYRNARSAFGYIWALNAAGTASLAAGDVNAARRHARELLTRSRRIGSAAGLGMALLLLAAVEANSGEGVRSAGLLGAWETCAGMIDTPPATTSFLCARVHAVLERNLEDNSIKAGSAAGRRWSIEEAFEIASAAAEER
jgi:tetratricopeptide (TPR) repeat protein